jgi:hypothetical protein
MTIWGRYMAFKAYSGSFPASTTIALAMQGGGGGVFGSRPPSKVCLENPASVRLGQGLYESLPEDLKPVVVAAYIDQRPVVIKHKDLSMSRATFYRLSDKALTIMERALKRP